MTLSGAFQNYPSVGDEWELAQPKRSGFFRRGDEG
jgi:hypothetical protein